MGPSKEKQIKIIQDGFRLLYEDKKYTQTEVVAKLIQLECKIGVAVFNRIIKDKQDELSESIVEKVYRGYLKLMEKEICLELNKVGKWVSIENAIPQEIILHKTVLNNRDIQFHTSGRLAPEEKILFFSSAQEEMIEFGLTLNTFSIYLNNINQDGLRKSLIQLLQRNVKVKCFLLDPDWHGTSMYFDDRELVIKEEMTGVTKIRASIRRLQLFYADIKDEKYCDNFEVYTYRHFPNNYFLAIDRSNNAQAKMMISNYLFGQKRVQCPVLEFSRAEQSTLFLRYDESLQKIITNAKKINLLDDLN